MGVASWGLKHAMRHVPAEDHAAVREAHARAAETGVLEHENRVRWPDGSIHWIRANGRIHYDDDGRPVRIVGVVADITEAKRSEQALRESEARFRIAVRNAAVVPAQVDQELRYQWIYNPHPDFDPDQVIGKRDDEIDDSDGSRTLMALKRRVLARA
jgi:PAS domain-containing protein